MGYLGVHEGIKKRHMRGYIGDSHGRHHGDRAMGLWNGTMIVLGLDFDPLGHDSGIGGALRVGMDVVRPDGDKGGVPWMLSSTWGVLSTFLEHFECHFAQFERNSEQFGHYFRKYRILRLHRAVFVRKSRN